jgi:hypothetical protein
MGRKQRDCPPGEAHGLAADDLTGENNQASSLHAKIARYDRAKGHSASMVEFLQDAYDHAEGEEQHHIGRVLLKLEGCSNWLKFHHYYTVDQLRLTGASFCKKHLLCQMCAIRRAAKMMAAYLERYDYVMSQHPELKGFVITFTVKNGWDLAERFDHLNRSLKTLKDRRRNFLTGSRSAPWTEFAKVQGAFGAIETTKNPTLGYHPHCHIIALCADEPDQQALRNEWEGITGDSFMVDVTPFHPDAPAAAAFAEVMKYTLKPGELTLADQWHAYKVFQKKRLTWTLGLLHGVKVPESLTDDELEGLPYVELFYRYLDGSGYSLESQKAVDGPVAGSVLPGMVKGTPPPGKPRETFFERMRRIKGVA